MPIFRFAAIAGAILLALLFVADATLAPRGPLFTNNSEGLPRPQPIRQQQQAELSQDAPRPRAPALVPDTPPQSAVAEPSPAATQAAAPPVAAVETAGTASARTQARTESFRTEPATTASTKLEESGTEAAKAAPAPKTRKQARRSERSSRYAAYRDDVPGVENGYAYGVPFRRERAEWQRPWGGEFGQNRYRF